MIANLLSYNIIVLFVIIGIVILFLFYTNTESFSSEKNKYSIEEFVITFDSAKKMITEINIPYAIVYGTALGAHRNSNFIPHDDDIDIMIFHDDLKKLGHITLKEQKKYINTIAKKYQLIPKSDITAPYTYVDKKTNMSMPILYQYIHEKTKMGVDFYVFYEFKNDFWCFIDGGERDLKGYKYLTNNKFFKTKLNVFEVPSCPIDFLYASYGIEMNTPQKKNDKNYYNQKREYFGKFPDEWLIPLE
jgi:phosphorylcholine metabolism protein LicD